MLISGNNHFSNIATGLVETAHNFLPSQDEAMAIFAHQKEVTEQNWNTVCDEAQLSATDRKLLWGRQFLNPFAFERLWVN